MVDRPGLTSRQHDAGAQLLLIMLDLLPHGLRAADDGEDTALDVVPGLLLVEERAAVLDDGRRRPRRGVARRRQRDTLEQILDEVPEVWLELLTRLSVRL